MGSLLDNSSLKRSRGRPTKLTPAVADRLHALLASGVTVADAAHEIGVHKRTVYYWLERRLVDATSARR
jgi:hypothetical protein